MTTLEEHLTMIVGEDTTRCKQMARSQDSGHLEGVEIKIARIRAGLRQYEVATSVGILPNRLSEIEAGRRRPSPELLERILQVIEGTHHGQ